MKNCGRWGARVLRGTFLYGFVLLVFAVLISSSASAAVGTVYTVDTIDGMTDGVCGGASDCSLGDAV